MTADAALGAHSGHGTHRAPARHRAAGLATAVVAAGVGALAHLSQLHDWGFWLFAAGLFVVQVVLALAWTAALDARGSAGAALLGVLAAAVTDGVLAGDPDRGLRVVGAVGGLSLVAGLLHQLSRNPRPAVIGSLSAAASLVVLELAAGSMLALRSVAPRSGDALAAGLFGLAAGVVVARVVDLVLPRPGVAPASSRGVFGVLAGLVAAGAMGSLWGQGRLALGGNGTGVRIAIVAALIGLVADVAVDVAAAAADLDDRSRAALAPLTVLLPVALAGPAIYVAARYLLG